MDNAVNAFIVAQYTQDRLTEAGSARRAGEAKTKREPKLRHARRWLTRRPPAVAPTSEPSRTITVLPPV